MSEAFVYFIRPIGEEGPIKIGTSNNPERRLRALNCVSPVQLEIFKTVVGGVELEGHLHSMFSHLRTHGEWFRAEQELLDFIREVGAVRPVPSPEPLGLTRYLIDQSITQTAFAGKLGITQATLSRYISGERKVPISIVAKVRSLTSGAVDIDDWLASARKPTPIQSETA